MDNREESPSWLPDGAARPATDETVTQSPVTPSSSDNGSRDSFGYGQDGLYRDERGEGGRYHGGGPAYDPGSRSEKWYGSDASHPAQGSPTGSPYPPPNMTQPDVGGAPRRSARTAVYSTGTTAPKQAQPQPRRANLTIARFEPWSVMKFSFLMSLVAWLVLFVAVALLYFFLSQIGVFSSLQHTLSSVTSSQSSSGVQLSHYVSASKVLGYTMLFGAINVVIITTLSTVGAVIYNLVTRLGAGIEVTLRESN